jgi:hypothetical protein
MGQCGRWNPVKIACTKRRSDRLAQLANTQATRTLLAVAAFQWRKLAEKAAERQKRPWPLVPDAVRMN